MYPDTPTDEPGDEMDRAARREFFGESSSQGGPPSSALGTGIDRPWVPDPTTDHPMGDRLGTSDSAYGVDRPDGTSPTRRTGDQELIDNAGYDGDAPEQRGGYGGEEPYEGRYASNE